MLARNLIFRLNMNFKYMMIKYLILAFIQNWIVSWFSAEYDCPEFRLVLDFVKTFFFHSGKRIAICTFVPLINS